MHYTTEDKVRALVRRLVATENVNSCLMFAENVVAGLRNGESADAKSTANWARQAACRLLAAAEMLDPNPED